MPTEGTLNVKFRIGQQVWGRPAVLLSRDELTVQYMTAMAAAASEQIKNTMMEVRRIVEQWPSICPNLSNMLTYAHQLEEQAEDQRNRRRKQRDLRAHVMRVNAGNRRRQMR